MLITLGYQLPVPSYLYSIGVIVQQQHPGTGDFLRFYHGLEVGQQTHVFGHVGGQHLLGKGLMIKNGKFSIHKIRRFSNKNRLYHVDNHFSESLPLFFVDVLEYVASIVLQELESHR